MSHLETIGNILQKSSEITALKPISCTVGGLTPQGRKTYCCYRLRGGPFSKEKEGRPWTSKQLVRARDLARPPSGVPGDPGDRF